MNVVNFWTSEAFCYGWSRKPQRSYGTSNVGYTSTSKYLKLLKRKTCWFEETLMFVCFETFIFCCISATAHCLWWRLSVANSYLASCFYTLSSGLLVAHRDWDQNNLQGTQENSKYFYLKTSTLGIDFPSQPQSPVCQHSLN